MHDSVKQGYQGMSGAKKVSLFITAGGQLIGCNLQRTDNKFELIASKFGLDYSLVKVLRCWIVPAGSIFVEVYDKQRKCKVILSYGVGPLLA